MNKPTISIFLLAAVAAACFVIPPHLHPLNYPADDAYFYLQTASNIYAGNGSTFNQITMTNGYHPLWMLICIAAFFLAGGSKIIALHILIAVQQALALGIIFLFYKICAKLKLRYWFVAMPLLLLYFSTRLYCSEAYINGFFVLLTILYALKTLFDGDKALPRQLAVIGILGGFAMLARLDNLFLVAVIFVSVLIAALRKQEKVTFISFLSTGLTIGLPFLAVFLPYLAYNYHTFGHLAPVSGAIKSTLPHISFNLGGLSTLGKLCLLTALLSLPLAFTKLCSSKERFVISTLSVGFILHMAQIIFTTNHHTGWPWYYFGGILNMAFFGTVIADRILNKEDRTGIPAVFTVKTTVITALLLTLVIEIYTVARYRNPAPTIELQSILQRLHQTPARRWQDAVGLWLKDNLSPNSRIMIYDWPGIIAYRSNLHILPPDGLINDYRYNDDLMKLGINGYLKEKNILYWLGPTHPTAANNQAWYKLSDLGTRQHIEIFAPLYKKSCGAFTVTGSNRVARLQDVISHPDLPDLSLWQISLPPAQTQ